MPEHAIAKREPMDFKVMEQAATVMANSGLFPIWNSKERVMTLMMLCQAEGIDPLSGVNRYDYINGRIAKKATAIQADFQRNGGKVEWITCTNTVAKVKVTTADGVKHEEEFTLDDARTAQLVKPNSGWTKYPKAMLRARCITFAIRAVDPGSLNLMVSSEEAADIDPVKEINITPAVPTETKPEDQLNKEEKAIEPEIVEPEKKVTKNDKPKSTPKKKPEPKESKQAEEKADELEGVGKVSETLSVQEWVKSLGEDKVNKFLKVIKWGKIKDLTDANWDYIDSERESFENNVNKNARGE